MRGPGGSSPARLGLSRAGNKPGLGLVRSCPIGKPYLLEKAVRGGVHEF